MRILFVCSGNGSFIVSNLASVQADSLVEHNIDVELYYVKGKGIVGYIKNILPLRKQISRNHYNIIHAHYGLCGWIAFIAKNRNTKLVISFMGNDILGDHANNGQSTVYGNFLVNINLRLAKYADYIIVKSREMSDKISQVQKSIIPNGVNLQIFFPLDRHLALKRVGWDPHLAHILFMSNPDRPEKNFNLLSNALKHFVTGSVQTHFLCEIPPSELIYYYNASDVCILTSYHEGSPNVVKEAMACNRPIVCTNVGDVSMLLAGVEGCYVCNFDPPEVFEKLLASLKFAQKYGFTNGRERIIELGLDSETVAGKLLEVYKKVMKEGIRD